MSKNLESITAFDYGVINCFEIIITQVETFELLQILKFVSRKDWIELISKQIST